MKKLFLLLIIPILITAQGHLLITEVLIPPSGETGKAFVEIYNPGSENVDLSNYYLANYNSYYTVVNQSYSGNTAHFTCRFPAQDIEAGKAIVVALNGAEYKTAFGRSADLEINGTDAQATDMIGLEVGTNPILEYTKGMVVFFYWDGQSDLVKDVDYLPWGLAPFHSNWMDKSSVSIDGPDVNTDESAYLADVATSQQKARSAPSDGQSLQRDGLQEISETASAGNGITGHNETSEDWTQSFTAAQPTPGSYSENPGDGSGYVQMSPISLQNSVESDFTFQFSGSEGFSVASVEIEIPDEISWSQSQAQVQLAGDAFVSASISVSAQTILIEQVDLTATKSGSVTLLGLTSPATEGSFVFGIRTAVDGGTLTPIASSPPTLFIYATMTIEEARLEPTGSEVTIQGVVTIGAGVLRKDFTDAYMQDASGYGINIYKSGAPDTHIKRGNLLLMTGITAEYQGKIEITTYTVTVLDTGQAIPGIRKMNTEEATALTFEGSFVEITGAIENISVAGGGTTLYINDGSGAVGVRAWDTAGLNLDGFSINDYVTVRGVISTYNNLGQITLGYQEDIFLPQFDGSAAYLKVEPYPFAPDHGESIKIEYSSGAERSHITLRIFDLSGRLVTTLKDGNGLPFAVTYSWDGLDRLGEYVPLGSYLCHLDVVNEDTGKRTVKIAPIVVGTVLR